MKTETKIVTPAIAREWLAFNTANRPLRRMKVDEFHQLYERGEWKLTHQGIAFDSSGILKDGQHRLTFISELPDSESVPIQVTFGMADDTFGAIDRGAGRTPSDEMGITVGLSAVSTFIAKVYNSNQHMGWTLPYLAKFVEIAQPYYEELNTFCPKKARHWSSAPVQSAAIIQMMRGHNADFIKTQYRALVHSDFQSMTPTAQAIVRQQLTGKVGGARTLDLFCRALRVFDSMSPSASRIQIASVTETTKGVRDFLLTQVEVKRLKKTDPRHGGSKVAKTAANSKALGARL